MLFDEVEILEDCKVHQAGHEHTTIFFIFAHIQGRQLTCFLICHKLYPWLFHRLCSREVFQTVHYYNLAWGLPIHNQMWWPWLCFTVTGVSESETASCCSECCPQSFKRFVVLTFFKKNRYSMLCVAGEYWRDITNTFFSFCTWMWVIWAFALVVL